MASLDDHLRPVEGDHRGSAGGWDAGSLAAIVANFEQPTSAPMKIARILLSSLCVLSLMPALAAAEDSAPAASLLTPLGAEASGNAEGSVPAWVGDNVGPANRSTPAQFVSRDNAAAYAALLSPGQKALLDALPDSFRMPIYGARRSYAPPAAFAAATAAGAGRARIDEDGTVSGIGAGLPFPRLGDPTDPGIRSSAALSLSVLFDPEDGDEITGPRFVIHTLVQHDDGSPGQGAALGGVLLLGDKRVMPLLA